MQGMGHAISAMHQLLLRSDMERQSGMERSYQRYSNWYDNQLPVKSIIHVGNLPISTHCVTIYGSTVGCIHNDSDLQKIHSESTL